MAIFLYPRQIYLGYILITYLIIPIIIYIYLSGLLFLINDIFFDLALVSLSYLFFISLLIIYRHFKIFLIDLYLPSGFNIHFYYIPEIITY